MPEHQVVGDVDHAAVGSAKSRISALDGWRGACIIAVLIGHFAPIHFIDFGDLGVEMFFVLSGRLMADILFVEKFPLKQFYIRRFSRVWPGVLVYALFCLAVFSHNSGLFLHVGARAFFAAISFTTNYKIAMFGQTQLLDHTWSLSVEEHSYLLLGILAFVLRDKSVLAQKSTILACALLMVLNGILRSYVVPVQDFDYPATMGYPPHQFDFYWLSDIRAASVFFAAFVYLHLRGAKSPHQAALPALLFAVLTFITKVPEGVSLTLGTLALAFAVCTLEGEGGQLARLCNQRLLIMFGKYSFSIYLWQQVFFKLFQQGRNDGLLSSTEGLLLRPVSILGACAAGVASYYLVEAPARRYINTRWSGRASRRPDRSRSPA